MRLLQKQQKLIADVQRRQQEQLVNLLRTAIDASEDDLRAALKSPVAVIRFAAAYAVGERRLFWQDDLISLLKDDDDAVRQSARRSLVILSFLSLNPEVAAAGPRKPGPPQDKLTPPRDFGPKPRASAEARKKAAEEWTGWWEEQGKASLKSSVTAPKNPEADKLSGQLVKAADERRKELLKEYAEKSGAEYTLAIAYAIPSLSGDIRKEARSALAERLSGRKEATLLRYLDDDDPEVRRAAALALGMRDAKETVANVANLLLDPEPTVVRAAQASLVSLTGEDYGPAPNATEEEKQEAVKKYQDWRPQP
jgi:HEAT repeat protein